MTEKKSRFRGIIIGGSKTVNDGKVIWHRFHRWILLGTLIIGGYLIWCFLVPIPKVSEHCYWTYIAVVTEESIARDNFCADAEQKYYKHLDLNIFKNEATDPKVSSSDES